MSILSALSALMRDNPENRMQNFPPPPQRTRPQAQLMSPQDLPSADRHGLGVDAMMGVGDKQVRAEVPLSPGDLSGLLRVASRAKLHPLEQSMVDKFGLTRSSAAENSHDVGFILSDGTTTSRGKAGDHSRMASESMGEEFDPYNDRWDAINSFIEETGAIRASPTGKRGVFDVANGQIPNSQQMREIARITRGTDGIDLNVGPDDFHNFRNIGELQRFFSSVKPKK